MNLTNTKLDINFVREQFPEGGNNPDFIEKLFVDNKFKQEIINKVKTIYREQYLKKSKKHR